MEGCQVQLREIDERQMRFVTEDPDDKSIDGGADQSEHNLRDESQIIHPNQIKIIGEQRLRNQFVGVDRVCR